MHTFSPRRHALACILSLLVLAIAPAARAATSCTISTTGLAFGTYDPTVSSAVFSNGSVSVNCKYSGTGFAVSLTLATGNSGTYSSRSLLSGTQVLAYNVYVDAAYTDIFGNGTGGSYYFTGCYAGGTFTCPSGGGTSGQTLTGAVYGMTPGGQNVAAGAYTDTMVVTVTW